MSEFPTNDSEFEEWAIDRVDGNRDDGWSIQQDARGFFVPSDSPVKPRIGMTARLYGKGLGYRVRGLFLDGAKVYYRTKTEDREHADIELYGADAADILGRWDKGRSVFSIEMGGIGPGYEQCIQITAFEVLRFLLDEKPDAALWEDSDIWKEWRDRIESHALALDAIKTLGLSGAQYGAAVSLATALYSRGPRACLGEVPKDRHIQVSRTLP